MSLMFWAQPGDFGRNKILDSQLFSTRDYFDLASCVKKQIV